MSKKTETDKPETTAVPAVATPQRSFEVSLPMGPKAVVKATDEADAWQVFCREQGVVKSKHQPTIAEVKEPAEPAKAETETK